MSISNLAGTGKINKLNNIYYVRYSLLNYNTFNRIYVYIISSVKIDNINDLLSYIRSHDTNLYATGYIFRSDMKMVYVTGIQIINSNLSVNGYNEDNESYTFAIPTVIPEGETGTLRVSCKEV